MPYHEASMRDRALSVLRGEAPHRLPLITRLETWYSAHQRAGTLPVRFAGMSLDEVHRAVGVGRLKFCVPYALKLKGVEVRATFNGEPLYHESEPVLENFPGLWDIVPTDRPGITQTEILTGGGKLTLTHMLLPEHVQNGTDPYLKEHLIKGEDDYRLVETILERAELIPLFEKTRAEWDRIGEHGMVVPLLQRIPFQQVLLEYLGEFSLFYALQDDLPRVRRLIDLLDQQMRSILPQLAALDLPYVEFPDNLHGLMTNPRLFRQYCLPAYQEYCQILHGQGKKVGSHTDGNIQPLLGLLKETSLDVCESFSPVPLTPCTFQETTRTWQGRPLIWGAIPSPILEEGTSPQAFEAYLAELWQAIADPLILGVVDLFLPHNSIDRLEQIARQVESLEPAWRPGIRQ